MCVAVMSPRVPTALLDYMSVSYGLGRARLTPYLEVVARLWTLSASPPTPLVSHLPQGRVSCLQLLWHSCVPDSSS